MVNQLGRLNGIGLAKEAVRGTAIATPDFWLQWEAINHDDVVTYVDNVSGSGSVVDSRGSEVVSKHAEGGYDFLIGSESFGLPLLSTLGAVSSAAAGGETAVYDHTFTLTNTSERQTLTVFEDTPNGDRSFANAVSSGISISFEAGKLMNYSLGLTSFSGESKTLSASCPVENVFRPQDFSIKMADDVAGLDAASVIVVKTASVEIACAATPNVVLGQLNPADILSGTFGITGKFSLLMDDATYTDLQLNGSHKALRLSLQNGDVDIGVASHPGFTMDLSKCFFQEISNSKGLDDLVEQEVTFKATIDCATGLIVDNVVLTNTTASY